MFTVLLILPWLLVVAPAAANDAEMAALQKALAQTQTLLTTPDQRKGVIDKDKSAARADKALQNLSDDPKTREAIYALAAEVLGKLAKDYKYDAEKMEKALQKAVNDPKAFAETFTPEQREKLKKLAEKIHLDKPKP